LASFQLRRNIAVIVTVISMCMSSCKQYDVPVDAGIDRHSELIVTLNYITMFYNIQLYYNAFLSLTKIKYTLSVSNTVFKVYCKSTLKVYFKYTFQIVLQLYFIACSTIQVYLNCTSYWYSILAVYLKYTFSLSFLVRAAPIYNSCFDV